MAGTILVLAMTLVVALAVGIGALVATLHLARRNGLRLKKISLSLLHGYTAEFHDDGTTERK
jgi:hypothetical protein